MKKIVCASLIAFAASFVAVPALACEFHGGGMAGYGSFGSKWNHATLSYDQSYSTSRSRTEQRKQAKAKKKPSFSNVAKLASSNAQAKTPAKNTQARANGATEQEQAGFSFDLP